MLITYVLLSPTFGMHQYTADLVNRIADGGWRMAEGEHPIDAMSAALASGPQIRNPQSAIRNPGVRLVTTKTYPRDRYCPAARIETPLTSRSTGFSREGLDLATYRRVRNVLTFERSSVPTLIHFTGVHAWNVPLVWALRKRGIPVIHTLHDLFPHGGVRHAWLITYWNRLIIRSGCHLLVHGRCYRDELLSRGVPASQVTHLPLLHGFWGIANCGLGIAGSTIRNPKSEIRNPLTVLFFGRVEAYKGVDVLLAAWESLQEDLPGARLIIAGPVAAGVVLPSLPRGVELRDRRIEDGEAFELFRSARLLVLPYRNATQSALVAAAYTFELPVIVTETGALPEYVVEGETGWVVPPAEPQALAAALRAALADPARLHAMGRAGHAWATARRGEEQAALWHMYSSLLGSTLCCDDSQR